jgi:hypothetical protein
MIITKPEAGPYRPSRVALNLWTKRLNPVTSRLDQRAMGGAEQRCVSFNSRVRDPRGFSFSRSRRRSNYCWHRPNRQCHPVEMPVRSRNPLAALGPSAKSESGSRQALY